MRKKRKFSCLKHDCSKGKNLSYVLQEPRDREFRILINSTNFLQEDILNNRDTF